MVGRWRGRALIAGGLVVATLAAGCVAGDDTTADGAATSATAGATDGPLTASYRGVTEDAVEVGISYIDLEAVGDVVTLDHGDYEAAYTALIDEINAAGGILGRRIEPVFVGVDPLSELAAEEACLELTEDEEVFVAVGQFGDDAALCYAELHDTAAIGGTMRAETAARAAVPWFTDTASVERTVQEVIEAFVGEGELDGAEVAVLAGAGEQQVMNDVALPALAEAGIEPVDTAVLEPFEDATAADNQVAIIAERFDSAGADTVLTVGGAAAVTLAGGLEDLGYRPRILSTNLSLLRAYIRDQAGRDLEVLDGAVAGNQAEQLIWWDDPAVQDCIATVEAANPGTTILDPNTRELDEPENIVSVANACRLLDLLVQVGEAAGTELTNDTLATGAAAVGESTLPGLGAGSLGPDKSDFNDTIYLYRWDDEAQDLVSDGVPL